MGSIVSRLKGQLRNVPLGLLLCLCAAHCCNDILQAVITALYPILKSDLGMDFAQIGLVTLVYQLAASLLQPVVGYFLTGILVRTVCGSAWVLRRRVYVCLRLCRISICCF